MTDAQEATPTEGDIRDGTQRRVELDAQTLRRFLLTVAKYASKERRTRDYMCGACLEFGCDDGVRLTATDGHRLMSLPLGADPLGCSYSAILSTAALKWAAKHLVGFKGVAALDLRSSEKYTRGKWVRHTNVWLEWGASSARLETVEGVFPDWRRVVPGIDGRTVNVRLNPEDWLRALHVLGSIYETKNQVAVIERGALAYALPDGHRDRIGVSGEYDDWTERGFNFDFLSLVLSDLRHKKHRGPYVQIYGDRFENGPIRLVSDAYPGLICVLMPRRI